MAAPLFFPRFRAFTVAGTGPLNGGKLFSYIAGTSTPQDTYTDSTLGTPNSNPTILSAAGEADVWIGALNYKFILKDSLDVTIWTEDNVSESGVAGLSNASSVPTFVPAASVGGSANAITLAPTPAITAYAAGQRFSFPAGAANTAAVTIATNGLATRALQFADGTAMVGGELFAGGLYDIEDTGTVYNLLNSAQGSGLLTFTPGIAFSASLLSVGVTYGSQQGSYMKLGRIVHFWMVVTLTSKGSSTGQAFLTGLPYSCNAAMVGGGEIPCSIVHTSNVTPGTNSWVSAAPTPNAGAIGKTLGLWISANGAVDAVLLDTAVANTSKFFVSGFYPV